MNFARPYGENEESDDDRLDPYRVQTKGPQLNTVPSFSSSEEESDQENDAKKEILPDLFRSIFRLVVGTLFNFLIFHSLWPKIVLTRV